MDDNSSFVTLLQIRQTNLISETNLKIFYVHSYLFLEVVILVCFLLNQALSISLSFQCWVVDAKNFQLFTIRFIHKEKEKLTTKKNVLYISQIHFFLILVSEWYKYLTFIQMITKQFLQQTVDYNDLCQVWIEHLELSLVWSKHWSSSNWIPTFNKLLLRIRTSNFSRFCISSGTLVSWLVPRFSSVMFDQLPISVWIHHSYKQHTKLNDMIYMKMFVKMIKNYLLGKKSTWLNHGIWAPEHGQNYSDY